MRLIALVLAIIVFVVAGLHERPMALGRIPDAFDGARFSGLLVVQIIRLIPG